MSNMTDYLAAIDRELAKRATTYPRLVEKKRKQGYSDKRIHNELERHATRIDRLQNIRKILRDGIDYLDPQSASDYLTELRREMKMRETVYNRLILFKRITPQSAAEQKFV